MARGRTSASPRDTQHRSRREDGRDRRRQSQNLRPCSTCHCSLHLLRSMVRRKLPPGARRDGVDARSPSICSAISCGCPVACSGTRISAGCEPGDFIEHLPFGAAHRDARAGGKLDPRQRRRENRRRCVTWNATAARKLSVRPSSSGIVGERARRHQPNDVALDDTLGLRRRLPSARRSRPCAPPRSSCGDSSRRHETARPPSGWRLPRRARSRLRLVSATPEHLVTAIWASSQNIS